MKLFNLIFLLALALTVSVDAQVIGKVANAEGEAIEWATVSLFEGEKLLDGSLTDENGQFEFEKTPQGEVRLQISFIGYQDLTKDIRLEGTKQDLGTLVLTMDNSLEEVVVTARKPTIIRKIDRIVFDVQNSPILAGGTAWDALKKSPSVRVQSNGAVSVKGAAATILINERSLQVSQEDLADYLRSIPANALASIEIFSTPPAKFDAEGGSLINIIIKKSDKTGINGTLWSKYEQRSRTALSAGANAYYRQEKISLFGKYSYKKGDYYATEQEKILYNEGTPQAATWDMDHEKNSTKRPHNYSLGMDYRIKSNHVVGAYFSGYSNTGDAIKTIDSRVSNETGNDSTLATINNSDYNKNQFSTNLSYRTRFDTFGRKMIIDLDYTKYTTMKGNNLSSNIYDNTGIEQNEIDYRSTAQQDVNLKSAKVDFHFPIKSSLLEFGTKASFVTTENDLVFLERKGELFVNDPNRSNQFRYQENTEAAYLSWSKEGRLSYKLGLRTEFTQTNGDLLTVNEQFKNNYVKFFPSGFLQYVFNENYIINARYSKRIFRPQYWQLNPFRYYSNPYSYSEGNPLLKPADFHMSELTFIYKGRFVLSGFHVYLNDFFTQISEQDNDTQSFRFTQANLDQSQSFGLVLVLPFSPFPWLDITDEFQFSHQIESSAYLGDNYKYNNNSFYASVTAELTLSKKHNLTGEVSGWYESPLIQGIFRSADKFDLSLGLKKTFPEKGITISAAATDLFYSNPYKTTVDYLDQNYSFKERNDTRSFRFSLSWNFGNNKIGRKSTRTTSGDEEKQRID